MENMSFETIEAIVGFYDSGTKGDKELVRDILSYLAQTTVCKKLKLKIEDWFLAEGLCTVCGGDLLIEHYEDIREDGFKEKLSNTVCTVCKEEF